MPDKKFDDIKSYYEDLYASAKEDSFPFDEKRTGAFLSFFGAIDAGLNSLDIGCGVGYACMMMEAKGYKAHGIDISETALAFARKKLPQGVFIAARESGAIDFSDTTFDAITCLGVLEHITDPQSVIREAYRVLKSGGTAVFLVPNSRSPYFMFSKGTGQIYEMPRTAKQWLEMFGQAGFRCTRIAQDPGPTMQRNFSLIKRLKVVVNKGLNLLPGQFAYQLLFVLIK